MERFQKAISRTFMNIVSRDDIRRAKAERRRQLVALPLEEKVRIMEQLQQVARTMIAARKQKDKNGKPR